MNENELIAGVWFAFGGDAECLRHSVAMLRRTYGQRARVCVFDDAKAPCDKAIIDAIAPDLYRKTRFDRGGNLNGKACLLGELRCYLQACRATGADLVMKVDCDTLILRNWLDVGCRWQFEGIWLLPMRYASGICYAFRRSGAQRLLDVLTARPNILDVHKQHCGKIPEDAALGFYASVLLPGACYTHDYGLDSGQTVVDAWCYRVPGRVSSLPSHHMHNSILCFGNRNEIPGNDDGLKRRLAAITMQNFIEYYNASR